MVTALVVGLAHGAVFAAGRTWAYVVLMAAAVLVALALVELNRILTSRNWLAHVRGAALTCAAAAALVLLLAAFPDAGETVPADISPQLLWDFRLGSLAQWATMWAATSIAAGVLLQEAFGGDSAQNSAGKLLSADVDQSAL